MPGDIILGVEDRGVDSIATLISTLDDYRIGEEVTLIEHLWGYALVRLGSYSDKQSLFCEG